MIQITYEDGTIVLTGFEGSIEDFIEWNGDTLDPTSLRYATKIEVV